MQRAKTYNFDEMTQFDKVKKDHYYADDEALDPVSLADETLLANFNLREFVSTSLKLESGYLALNREENLHMKMLANLTVQDMEGYQRPNIDLVCVLDHSGSMTGEKIELVKNSFKYLLEFFKDNDRLSIVIFNHKAKRIFPLMKMTPENKLKAYQEIRSIWATGGTDINQGLCHALHILSSRRVKNKVSSVFLLSDGIDESAEFGFKRSMTSSDIDQDFTIHTFGFGNDHDSKLMTKIADMKDGNFYFLEQFHLIDECFVDCFGQLMCATAKEVEISLEIPSEAANQGISIYRAFGNDAMWQNDDEIYKTRLSNLLIGKSRNFILQLEIPPDVDIVKEEFEIARMKVKMVDFKGERLEFENSASIRTKPSTEVLDEEAEKEVTLQFYRVNAAMAMELAYTLCLQSKYEEAQQELVEVMRKMYQDKKLEKEEFVQNLIKDLERAFLDCNENCFGKHGAHNLLGNARAQMKESTYNYSSNYYGTTVQKDLRNMLMAKKSGSSKIPSLGKLNSIDNPDNKYDTNGTIPEEEEGAEAEKKAIVKILYDEGLEFTEKEFVNQIEKDALRAEITHMLEFKDEEHKDPTLYLMVLHRVDVIAPEKIKICEDIIKNHGDKSMVLLLKHPYNMNRNLKLERKGSFAFHQFNYGINSIVKGKNEVEHLKYLAEKDKETLFKSFSDFVKSLNGGNDL